MMEAQRTVLIAALALLYCSDIYAEGSANSLTFVVETKTIHTVVWSKVSSVHKDDIVRLTCTDNSAGPSTSSLTIKTMRGNRTLAESKSDKIVSHTFNKTSCDEMDTYVCEDGKGQNTTYELGIYDCPPSPCHGEKATKIMYGNVNETKWWSLCVIVYPNINEFAYLNGSKIIQGQLTNRWTWKSNKTATFKQRINVTVTKINDTDYGHHSFNISTTTKMQHFTFTLQLRRPGPPECPTNIRAKDAGAGSVKLSWQPGLSGGSNQSFCVFYSADNTTWTKCDKETNYYEKTDINNLKEAKIYFFRVASFNSLRDLKNVTEDTCNETIEHTMKSADNPTPAPTHSTSTESATNEDTDPGDNTVIIIIAVVVSVVVTAGVVAVVCVYMNFKRLYKRSRSNPRGSPPAQNGNHGNQATNGETSQPLMIANQLGEPDNHENRSGRYLSEQGLLYVTVDHSSHVPGHRPPKLPNDKVQYVTLDHDKTTKLKKKPTQSEGIYVNG